MGSSYRYTKEQEILIIDLYTRTPTSRIRNSNPDIVELCRFFNDHGMPTVVSGIRNKMENLKSVDPDYVSDGRVGRTKMAKSLRELWDAEMETGFAHLDEHVADAIAAIESGSSNRPSGTPPQWSSRTGQAAFRERVLTAFGGQCCISGMSNPSLIQACHIKPYTTCHDEGRADQEMDVRNGLCMNVLFHKAFDAGLFTIDEQHRVLLSESIKDHPTEDEYFSRYDCMHIHETTRTHIGPDYLEYHRKNIFQDCRI